MSKVKTQRFRRGNHLVAFRGYYYHHGIYLGKSKILHYTDKAIRITSMDIFMEDTISVEVRKHNEKVDIEKAISRGLSRLGESNYNLALNNCEHFVNWCLFEQHRSEQVLTVANVVDTLFSRLINTMTDIKRKKNNVI